MEEQAKKYLQTLFQNNEHRTSAGDLPEPLVVPPGAECSAKTSCCSQTDPACLTEATKQAGTAYLNYLKSIKGGEKYECGEKKKCEYERNTNIYVITALKMMMQ